MALDNIQMIKELPKVINGVHESCYPSYLILSNVKVMLNRGDSIETIKEYIDLFEKEK